MKHLKKGPTMTAVPPLPTPPEPSPELAAAKTALEEMTPLPFVSPVSASLKCSTCGGPVALGAPCGTDGQVGGT